MTVLFELQIPNPVGDSTYRQHQYVDTVIWDTQPDHDWQPRDYLWSEADGVLYIRRTLPTNDLVWLPIDLPPLNSTITMQLQARCRHSSLGDKRGLHDPNTKRGARRALIDPQDNLSWLERTAHRSGLVIEDAEVDLIFKPIIRRRSRGGTARLRFTLVVAQFVAVATVRDVARFEHALAAGVGDSKAFGCGYIHFWQRGQ